MHEYQDYNIFLHVKYSGNDISVLCTFFMRCSILSTNIPVLCTLKNALSEIMKFKSAAEPRNICS